MILRAIIVDDEPKGINSLKILIDRFVYDVKIVATTTKPIEAIALIEDYMPDVVFLDINMPGMNGFELIDKIDWKGFDLIFTTAHQEFAIKALRAEAVDYLLKPIDHEDLKAAITKVKTQKQINAKQQAINHYAELVQNASQSRIEKLIVSSKEGIESIDVNDILSLESKSNYTLINLTNARTVIATKTLKEFEIQLCDTNLNFMRVHHSFIVNLYKVARYLKGPDKVIMLDNQEIPVSKSKKEVFFKWMSI